MPVTDSLGNAWLDTLRGNAVSYATVYVSLHTANPGSTGGNEVTGGDYARQSVTWNAPANKQMTNSSTVQFPNMPAATITHFGLWTAASGGTFLWGGALSSSKTTNAGDTFVFDPGAITLQVN